MVYVQRRKGRPPTEREIPNLYRYKAVYATGRWITLSATNIFNAARYLESVYETEQEMPVKIERLTTKWH
jgi:hypothetical protein